jgi:hypothetical protein
MADKDDIKFCGAVPEAVWSQRTTAKDVTECKICPNVQCETIKTFTKQSDISITCRAQTLPGCLHDCFPSDIPAVNPSTVFPWYRTSDNCYVEAKSLTTTRRTLRKRIRDQVAGGSGSPNEILSEQITIDNCGPVPFLERNYRAPPLPLVVASSAVCTAVTVFSTVTKTVLKPTTIILRPAPCTTCQPLIFGYTPPMTLATEAQPVPLMFIAEETASTASILLPSNSLAAPVPPMSSTLPVSIAESSSPVALSLVKTQQPNSPPPAITQKPTQVLKASEHALISDIGPAVSISILFGLTYPWLTVSSKLNALNQQV